MRHLLIIFNAFRMLENLHGLRVYLEFWVKHKGSRSNRMAHNPVFQNGA